MVEFGLLNEYPFGFGGLARVQIAIRFRINHQHSTIIQSTSVPSANSVDTLELGTLSLSSKKSTINDSHRDGRCAAAASLMLPLY
jgi:hypothetical protein